MIVNIGVSASFLIVLLILIVSFYSKEKIDSLENRCFKKLIPITMIGLITEVIIYCLVLSGISPNNLVLAIVIKLLYIYYVFWMFYFVLYGYIVFFSVNDVNTDRYKRFKHFIRIFYGIALTLSLVLPIDILITDIYLYPYGVGTTAQYAIVSIGMIIIFISAVKNKSKLKKKESIPFIVCIFLGIISVITQYYFHEFLFIVPSHAIAVILMYFTIENPDVRMIEQLNIARDQAEKANNAKSDFLSSMSHEIRTPLNAIVGFSQALSEEELPLQAKEEVKDIMMASETLLDIVNGILDISKIEANKLEIVNTEYSFNTVLEELVSLTKARLGEKPLDFRYSFSPDIPKYMYGDKVRVKQVILNLLTNAVKYTHEGWIEFKVNCVNRNGVCRLIISVQDTGIGIKQESINKLFNRFERLDIEKNNTIEGTGLGLAITKKLIELMGGQIVVQSVYGEGSKFTVAIDQRIVENPTNPNLEKTQVMDLSAIKNIDLTNRRILVVDDNKINLKVASRLLQDYHCIIDTIDSGIEAFEKIKMGATYDLILMDDMMPKQSGIETLHKLKELEGFNMPVVALTANAISGMKEKYLSEGFNDYLSKPIDKTELNRVLNKFIK